MKLLSGIENTLAARSTALLLQVVPDHDAEVEACRRWWAERRVDGIFLIDLRIEDKRVLVLEELGLPAVVIGGPGHHGRLPAVWSDDASAMAMVVEYLAALGHRRVARVAGPARMLTELRAQAFGEVAERLALESAVTVATDYSPEQGPSDPAAALGAPAADGDHLRQRRHGRGRDLGGPRDGRGRARDLSIVAWDDSVLCEIVHPPLTVLSRDIMAYGTRAAGGCWPCWTGRGRLRGRHAPADRPRQRRPPTRLSGGRLAAMRSRLAAALAAASSAWPCRRRPRRSRGRGGPAPPGPADPESSGMALSRRQGAPGPTTTAATAPSCTPSARRDGRWPP